MLRRLHRAAKWQNWFWAEPIEEILEYLLGEGNMNTTQIPKL